MPFIPDFLETKLSGVNNDYEGNKLKNAPIEEEHHDQTMGLIESVKGGLRAAGADYDQRTLGTSGAANALMGLHRDQHPNCGSCKREKIRHQQISNPKSIYGLPRPTTDVE